MAAPHVPREELKASLASRRELGEEFEPAIVEAFLDRVGESIDARVDARLGEFPQPRQAPEGRPPVVLPIASMALGIPITGVATGMGQPEGLVVAVVAWVAIAVINIAHALGR